MAKKENEDNHVLCVCFINGIYRLLVFNSFRYNRFVVATKINIFNKKVQLAAN